MAWATTEEVRRLTGLSISDVSDADLEYFIAQAQKIVRGDLHDKIYKEKLTGNINGNNKLFFTKFKPIADANYDKIVDNNDVSVWLYKKDETTNEETYTPVGVASVNAMGGAITLTNPPTTTEADYLVIDYDYFPYTVDWDLFTQATAFMAAHLVMLNLEGMLPSTEYTYRIGKRQVKRRGVDLSKTDSIDKFFWKYKDIISRIRSMAKYIHHSQGIKDLVDMGGTA